jgi:hypothetical protein
VIQTTVILSGWISECLQRNLCGYWEQLKRYGLLVTWSPSRRSLLFFKSSTAAFWFWVEAGTFFCFLWVGWDWVHLVRRPLTGILCQHWMIDDECEVVGGMRIGRGNRSTRRKPAPVSLCPSQILHNLTWARTRPATLGSRILTTWAMARLTCAVTDIYNSLCTKFQRATTDFTFGKCVVSLDYS